VSFVPLAARIGILQLKSKRPYGKGSRSLDEFPTALTTKSLRGQGGGGRRLAWPATSVESVRSLVGNHPQAAWIGLAINAKFVEWSALTRPSPVAGHAVDRLVPVTNQSTDCSSRLAIKPRAPFPPCLCISQVSSLVSEFFLIAVMFFFF